MGDEGGFDILLIEDDPEEAELALSALRDGRVAARVGVAKDGEQALDILHGKGTCAGRRPAKEGLKLILLDLKLPKLSGLEVLRRIKTDQRSRLIPVVVLTSSQLQGDVLEAYQLGVNGYLVKPVDFQNFGEMLARVSAYWLGVNRLPGPTS